MTPRAASTSAFVTYAQERKLSTADIESCHMRIGELEASLAEKKEFLGTLEEALLSATTSTDALKMERDAARTHADLAKAEATSSSTQIQELRDELDLKSIELEILSKLMLSVTTKKKITHGTNFQRMSRTLSHELGHECGTLEAVQHQLLVLTTTLEQEWSRLCNWYISMTCKSLHSASLARILACELQ